MTDIVVVDASVAIKWAVPESLSELALALLQDTLDARQQLFVPPHFHGEVTNAIYQRVRSTNPARQLTAADAEQALHELLNVPIEVATPSSLYEQSFAFARQIGPPSLYDSLYVVLAQMLGGELWTADRRLLAAVGTAAPWVRSLADYGTVRAAAGASRTGRAAP